MIYLGLKRLWTRWAKLSVLVVIPAYNEAATVGDVATDCTRLSDEIIILETEASTTQPRSLRTRVPQ